MIRSFRYAVISVLVLAFAGLSSAELRVRTPDALRAAVTKEVPDYPTLARQSKIVGRVEVEFTITAQGNVENVKVVSGNAMLSPSAVAAVKKWKFKPFTQDGAPAPAIATLDFDFKL